MHRDTLDDTSVVDEDIDVTNLLMDSFYESLYSILVSNVTYIAVHVFDASLFIVSESALESSLVDVIEDNVLHASSHESLGDVEANTVRCACNPRIFTLKGEIF